MRKCAPLVAQFQQDKPWEGVITKKPWNYQVTAVIPVLDTPEPLEACVALLRAQTEPPYILVIDTGSETHRERIASMEANDLEVHSIRSNAWINTSEPVAAACQLGHELCKTPFIFHTHSDCLLMRRDLLEDWRKLAEDFEVVGYQISPREYAGWESELGHTALMMRMESVLGVSWNMRRWFKRVGLPIGQSRSPNEPDTESEMNCCLADFGIKPLMCGTEANWTRNINADFDHPRSYCCSMIYKPDYYEKVEVEMEDALRLAWDRVKAWTAVEAVR